MRNHYQKKAIRFHVRNHIAFLIMCTVIMGCTAREQNLSPAARAFKKEVQETIKQLSSDFTAPLARDDFKAVQSVLKNMVSNAAKEGKPLKFRLAILDENGIKVTGSHSDVDMNFSGYETVRQILDKKEIVTGVLYLKNAQMLFIGAPLMQQGKIVGILSLGISEEDLKKHWNVSAQEVLTIVFNS